MPFDTVLSDSGGTEDITAVPRNGFPFSPLTPCSGLLHLALRIRLGCWLWPSLTLLQQLTSPSSSISFCAGVFLIGAL